MIKIPARELITIFQRMYNERWEYKWGACEQGKVDCAGAFRYAYRKNGLDLYQGSNRIERTEIATLLPISEAKPGMAAFKKREPGQSLYDLPSAYRPGGAYHNGDLSDYYHIGLVDADPRYVLNAQSAKTGFGRSPISQNWCGCGYMARVEYEEEKKMRYRVIGGSLNLRKTPSAKAVSMAMIPDGTELDVGAVADGWANTTYKGLSGWCMVKYMELLEEEKEAASIDEMIEQIDKLRDIALRMKEGKGNGNVG